MQWQQTEGVGHLDYCYGEDVYIKCNRCGKALCTYRGQGRHAVTLSIPSEYIHSPRTLFIL